MKGCHVHYHSSFNGERVSRKQASFAASAMLFIEALMVNNPTASDFGTKKSTKPPRRIALMISTNIRGFLPLGCERNTGWAKPACGRIAVTANP
jgi:hypothetical protein